MAGWRGQRWLTGLGLLVGLVLASAPAWVDAGKSAGEVPGGLVGVVAPQASPAPETPTPTATTQAAATATTTIVTPTVGPPPPPPPPSGSIDPASAAPYRLYVPRAYRAAGSWDSGIQVQNVGAFDATVYVSFYQGGSLISTELAATISAGASKTYYLPALNSVPNGFAGSVVIGASGPVAAVVNWTNYNVNGSGRSSSSAYNAVALDDTGPSVAVPALRYGSVLQIQNGGDRATRVRVSAYNAGGLAVYNQELDLGMGQAIEQNLTTARSEAGGGAVSAFVQSIGSPPQPLAVLQWGEVGSPIGVPMSVTFPGVAKPAPNVAAPLVQKRPTGWYSELAIMNVGTQTAQVQVQYFNDRGEPVAGATENVFVPSNGSYITNQAQAAGLPDNFVGAAAVSSTNGQPLAVAVLQANPGLNQATSYTGVNRTEAAQTLYAPLLMKANNGWDTGLQLQNAGSAATSVTVTFYARDTFTPLSSQTEIIQPNAGFTFFTPTAPGLPPTFVGSAVIRSTGGQPLIGVVNEVNYQIGNGGDNSLTYALVGGQ